LEEVAEAMAAVWDFVVDVDQAEGDCVVCDIEDHSVEVGDGVVGVEFDPRCNGLLGVYCNFAGVVGFVLGEVNVPHVVQGWAFLCGSLGVGVGSHGGNCVEP
jgi:hypothetical protein